MDDALKVVVDVEERLRYVGVLLELSVGRSEQERRALAGGAVFWLIAVDKALEDINPTIAGKRYIARRADSAGGKTLRALGLARNEIAHGSAFVTVSGATVPFTFPLVFHLRFVDAASLRRSHEARNKTVSQHVLAEYDRRVAGRSPESVIGEAKEWLSGLMSS